jgi:hypothetical protein
MKFAILSRESGRRNIQLHLLFFVILVFAACSLTIFDQVLSGYTLLNGNYLFSFEPWIHQKKLGQGDYNHILSDPIDWPNIYFHIKQLRHGAIPLWGFNEQLGKPGIFLMNNLLVDPLRVALWTAFDVPIGSTLEILIKFTAGGVFCWLYLIQIAVQRWIALPFSIGFVYGTSQIASYPDAFAFAPMYLFMVLFVIEKLCTTNSWKWAAALSGSFLYLATSAVAHVLFFSVFWILVYGAARILCTPSNRWALFFKVCVAGFFSMLSFSAYLLPTIEYFRNGINLDYRSGYGVTQGIPYALLNAFYGTIFGDPVAEAATLWKYGSFVNVGICVGFLAPVVTLTAGIFRLTRQRDFHFIFFAISSTFLLLEIYEFPFEAIEQYVNHIPLFRGNPPFHQNTFLQAFLSVLGALSLDYVFRTDFRKRKWEAVAILLSTACVCGFVLYHFVLIKNDSAGSPYLGTYFRKSIFLTALFLTIYVIILLKPSSVKLLTTALVLLSGLFLYEAKLNAANWVPSMKPDAWFPETETTQYLKTHVGAARVMPLDFVAVPETLAFYGLPVAVGRGSIPRPLMFLLFEAYADAYRHPTQTLFPSSKTDLMSKLWDLLDVRYFVGSKSLRKETLPDYGEKIKFIQLSDATILERMSNPQHAYLARDGIVVERDAALPNVFYKPDFDLLTHVILEKQSDLRHNDLPSKDLPPSAPIGSITFVKQRTNSVEIRAQINEPGYLVLSQYYYPGWKAYVDGKRVDIFRAYHFLSAIRVSNLGDVQIEFKYEPLSVYAGLALSVIGLLGGTVFFGLMVRSSGCPSRRHSSAEAAIKVG